MFKKDLKFTAMPLIEWKEDYSVNVLVIDSQHKTLIKMINTLNDAMKTGQGKEVTKKIISEMIVYTKNHFQTEEKYFDQFGYKESPKHKAEHQQFIDKVENFKNDYNAGKIGLSVSIMNFLSTWLRDHILISDKRYAEFMNNNDVY